MRQLLCGGELFQEFIAVAAEVCHIVDGYVQEPDHYVVAFFVDEKTDVYPVAHHRQADQPHACCQQILGKEVERDGGGVVEERGEDGGDVVEKYGGDCGVGR